MAERAQDDADLVRSEYADETGLTVRFALWERPGVPQPATAAYEAVLEAAPHRLLEVGCGRGEHDEAERLGSEAVSPAGRMRPDRPHSRRPGASS